MAEVKNKSKLQCEITWMRWKRQISTYKRSQKKTSAGSISVVNSNIATFE